MQAGRAQAQVIDVAWLHIARTKMDLRRPERFQMQMTKQRRTDYELTEEKYLLTIFLLKIYFLLKI